MGWSDGAILQDPGSQYRGQLGCLRLQSDKKFASSFSQSLSTGSDPNPKP